MLHAYRIGYCIILSNGQYFLEDLWMPASNHVICYFQYMYMYRLVYALKKL